MPVGKRLFLICVLLFVIIAAYRNQILKYIGDETFGGCCYNIHIAKAAYTLMSWHMPALTLPGDIEIYTGKPPQWAHHQLARIDFVSGDHYGALEHIETELRHYPDNMNSYYIKGLILGFMNRDHDAIEVFEYYTSQTDTWAGHNDLAWLYFKIGDYDNTLRVIDKVKDGYPDNIWLLNTRAISLYNLKRYKEAKVDIDKAIANYEKFTPEQWGASYPGNDPDIYTEGHEQMGKSLMANKKLIYSKSN